LRYRNHNHRFHLPPTGYLPQCPHIQRKRVDSLQVLQASTNGDSIDSVGGGSDRAGGVSPINGDGGGSIDGTAAVARSANILNMQC